MIVEKPAALCDIDAGTFDPRSYELGTLSHAFNSVRYHFAQARRLKSLEKKKEALAQASKYANTLLKAMAHKWSERGELELRLKIAEIKQHIRDPDRTVNAYDEVFLEFLEEEKKGLTGSVKGFTMPPPLPYSN